MSQPAQPTATQSLALLAKPRTDAYRDQFKPANELEQLGAHMWGQAVSASLHPLVGICEVVLRNAIHQALSEECSGGTSSSFAWYDRANPKAVPIHGKSLEKVEQILCQGSPPIRKAVQPSPDKVVSELTFGFWPNVMEGLSQRFAPKTFSNVFAYHPHSKLQHWSHLPNKEPVILRLKRLQDLRNRVCHFEPVWKPHWLGVSASNWGHSVAGLRNLNAEILELLGWCSLDAVLAYKSSFGWNWFNRICTTHAVRAFMSDHQTCAIFPTFEPGLGSGAGTASTPTSATTK
jgi:hypothetical protein